MNDNEAVIDDPTYAPLCSAVDCEGEARDEDGDLLLCSDCETPLCENHVRQDERARIYCAACLERSAA